MSSTLTLTGVATKWLALLPVWPAELRWLSTTPQVPDEWTLRWLREQLRQAHAQRAATPDDRVAVHVHLGLAADATFRQRLFNGLGLLLALEAAHASLAAWPTVAAWEAEPENQPETGAELGLFNPQRLTEPLAPLFLQRLSPAANTGDGRRFGLPGHAEEIVRLPGNQAAVYHSLAKTTPPPLTALGPLVQQFRLWYAPSAHNTWLMDGRVAALPAPVATWAYNYHVEAAPAGLAARLDAPATPYPAVAAPGRVVYPLLWQPSSRAPANRQLLRQSSVLFSFGRLPKPRRYSSRDVPRAWLELSLTLRPRPLDLYALAVPSVSSPPSLAPCFGLPAARDFSYQPAHFYHTAQPAAEDRLRQLLQEYYAVQERENALRAEAAELPLLPLPWNLLHWIADVESGRAVAAYITQRYQDGNPHNQTGASAEHRPQLERLVHELTALLAELRPVWRQLEQLPHEPAYVVVPAHLCQPAYLPGFRPLHERLFGSPAARFPHLTFLGYAQLHDAAAQPTWPIYLACVQGKYWWALRQHAPATPLHWLLHAGLYHDAFCQELRRQHEAEQRTLYDQLARLVVAHAPNAEAAIEELTMDLRATEPALPAHYQPTRFSRRDGSPAGDDEDDARDSPTAAGGHPASPGALANPFFFPWSRPEMPPLPDSEDADAGADEQAEAPPETQDTPDAEDARRQQVRLLAELEEDVALERYGTTPAANGTPEPGGLTARVAEPAPRAGRPRIPRVWLNGQDCGLATHLAWVQRLSAAGLLLERCALGSIAGGDYWLDEMLLRHGLREQARQQDTLNVSDAVLCPGGVPFWKIELGRWANENPGPIASNRIRRLYDKLQQEGLSISFHHFKNDYVPYAVDGYGRATPHQSMSGPYHIPQTWADRRIVCAFINEPSTDRLMLVREPRQELRRAQLRRYQEAGLAALGWVEGQPWEEFSLAQLTERLAARPGLPLLATAAIRELFGGEPDPARAVAEFVLARLRQSLRRVDTVTLD